MNTDSELESWGEEPSSTEELEMAIVLDDLLALNYSSKNSTPNVRDNLFPTPSERMRQLVTSATLVSEYAANILAEEFDLEQPDPEEVSPPAADPPNPFPDDFQIIGELGVGHFGRVWLAKDLHLGRRVAMKTLKLPADTKKGAAALDALRKEAQILARLSHPNIVRVHSWRQTNDEYFLIVEFVAGGSLHHRLREEKQPLSWQIASRYIADVGDGLVKAHAASVIHRDIKPENILWDAEHDEAVLTDFGLASHLAEPGTVAGTPVYMAPEAFAGKLSPALDVYALAATLFRLLTGLYPFQQTTREELVAAKLRGLLVPDPRFEGIPETLEQIVRDGLAPSPSERPSVETFVANLRASLNQLLADSLLPPQYAVSSQLAAEVSQRPVDLQLHVSRRIDERSYQPVVTTRPRFATFMRDMKKVPPAPSKIALVTGDFVRIDVVADRAGYLLLFNIGPSGKLNLLYPDSLETPSTIWSAFQALRIEIQMAPPAGCERLFAIWSDQPFPLDLRQLHSLAAQAESAVSASYQASRDMQALQQAIKQLPAASCRAVSVEIDHVVKA